MPHQHAATPTQKLYPHDHAHTQPRPHVTTPTPGFPSRSRASGWLRYRSSFTPQKAREDGRAPRPLWSVAAGLSGSSGSVLWRNLPPLPAHGPWTTASRPAEGRNSGAGHVRFLHRPCYGDKKAPCLGLGTLMKTEEGRGRETSHPIAASLSTRPVAAGLSLHQGPQTPKCWSLSGDAGPRSRGARRPWAR